MLGLALVLILLFGPNLLFLFTFSLRLILFIITLRWGRIEAGICCLLFQNLGHRSDTEFDLNLFDWALCSLCTLPLDDVSVRVKLFWSTHLCLTCLFLEPRNIDVWLTRVPLWDVLEGRRSSIHHTLSLVSELAACLNTVEA